MSKLSGRMHEPSLALLMVYVRQRSEKPVSVPDLREAGHFCPFLIFCLLQRPICPEVFSSPEA